jgi:hypothetical protein
MSEARWVLAGLAVLLLSGTAGAQPAQERFRPPTQPPPGAWGLGAAYRNTEVGAFILRVDRGSPAERMGLEVGDTVITVDGGQVGKVLGRVVELNDAVGAATERGRAATLLVRNGRDGRLLNARVEREVVKPPAERVAEVFRRYVRRDATRDEVAAYVRRLPPNATAADVENLVLSGPDYSTYRKNDDSQFIGGLFRDLMNREPVFPEGRDWLQRLKDLRGDRLRLVQEFRGRYGF